MTVIEREAELVRQGFELILAGGSIRSVMRLWNDADLTTARGRPWQPYSVRDAFRNARYAGRSVLKGEEVGDGAWPAIVPVDTYRAVRAILDDGCRRTTPAGPPRTYLLSGLAVCGGCSSLVVSGGTGRTGRRTYRCGSARTSHYWVRRSNIVEDYVTAVIVARLSRPDVVDLVAVAGGPDVGNLHAEASTLRTRRDQPAEAFATGEINRSRLAAGTRRLEGNLATVEAALTAAARTSALAEFVGPEQAAAVWSSLDLDRRRAVISELCEVTIHPVGQGTRLPMYDPGDDTTAERIGATLRIEWRQS